MAAVETFDHLLVKGYVREATSSAHHLPEELQQLIYSYHFNHFYFKDAEGLCMVNSIGNILTCHYAKYQFACDFMRSCLICFYHIILTIFMPIIMVLSLVNFAFIVIVSGISSTIYGYDNHAHLYFITTPSAINNIWVILIITVLCIYVEYDNILDHIDDHIYNRFKDILLRGNDCHGSIEMPAYDAERNIIYEYKLRILECKGDIEIEVGLQGPTFYRYLLNENTPRLFNDNNNIVYSKFKNDFYKDHKILSIRYTPSMNQLEYKMIDGIGDFYKRDDIHGTISTRHGYKLLIIVKLKKALDYVVMEML